MAGDIHFRVNIEKHPVFTRVGADLYMEKKVELLEALSGFTFTVKHFGGESIKCTTYPVDIISHGE